MHDIAVNVSVGDNVRIHKDLMWSAKKACDMLLPYLDEIKDIRINLKITYEMKKNPP